MTHDDYFGPATFDVDEQRSAPVPHRYVHGQFEGTDTRFSMYFVPESLYEGRFLQWLEGGPGGHEHEATNFLRFAASCGAYVVESNQGHIGVDPGPPDPSITGWRATEATARLGRELAGEMYGSAPHHGYLFGGSGGGMRTILGLEHVRDLWDGGVPFVAGAAARLMASGRANVPALTANAMRVLGTKLSAVVDAFEPGGSGDPYSTLDDDEAAALRKLLDAGFQPRALFELERPAVAALLLPMMMGALTFTHPGYVDDFWSTPGYPGADGLLADALVDHRGTVRSVVGTEELLASGLVDPSMLSASSVAPSMEMSPIGVVLDDAPQATKYATARFLSGKATDAQIPCFGTNANTVVLNASGREQADLVQPGDEIAIDNRAYLAFCLASDHAGERDASLPGLPMDMNGDFTGKMILVNSVLDDVVLPGAAIAYAELVHAAGRTDDFRLWWIDNAGHVPGMILVQGEPPVMATRLVNYAGCFEQGVRDLIAWVEDDVEPPASTSYGLEGAALQLPGDASQRSGVQPVVHATANGSPTIAVACGEAVTLAVEAAVPPGAGTVVAVSWDFAGDGAAVAVAGIDGSSAEIHGTVEHVYTEAGTYFPAVLVVAQRDGDLASPFGRIENVGRARVLVQ